MRSNPDIMNWWDIVKSGRRRNSVDKKVSKFYRYIYKKVEWFPIEKLFKNQDFEKENVWSGQILTEIR